MGSEEQLELELTPLEMIQKRYGDAKEGRIRAFLGHFGFDGNLVNHKIKTLSGGQKSRVSFALLTWTNPHLIVMDEPTNHLDLPTIDSLIGALEDFAGGIIVILHDLFFLTKIAAEFWAVDYAGGMKVFYDLDDAKEFSYRPIVWNVLEGMEKDIIRVDKKEERRQKRIEREKRRAKEKAEVAAIELKKPSKKAKKKLQNVNIPINRQKVGKTKKIYIKKSDDEEEQERPTNLWDLLEVEENDYKSEDSNEEEEEEKEGKQEKKKKKKKKEKEEDYEKEDQDRKKKKEEDDKKKKKKKKKEDEGDTKSKEEEEDEGDKKKKKKKKKKDEDEDEGDKKKKKKKMKMKMKGIGKRRKRRKRKMKMKMKVIGKRRKRKRKMRMKMKVTRRRRRRKKKKRSTCVDTTA